MKHHTGHLLSGLSAAFVLVLCAAFVISLRGDLWGWLLGGAMLVGAVMMALGSIDSWRLLCKIQKIIDELDTLRLPGRDF